MKPHPRFLGLDKTFWANVRTTSQQVGYTVRGKGLIKVPTPGEIAAALQDIGLGTAHICDDSERPTKLGRLLHDYFEYRAATLNTIVEPQLMDVDEARKLFERLRAALAPTRPAPMNKQSKEK